MKKVFILLIVAASIVLYDLMASLVSRGLQIEYSDFGFGSLVLYFLAGFVVSRKYGFLMGVLAGLVAGIADSTLGLYISELVGPYTSAMLDLTSFSAEDFVYIITFVTIQSTIFGSFGALVAYLLWGKEFGKKV